MNDTPRRSAFEFIVVCPDDMTIGSLAECEELLREHGQVERREPGFRVRVMRDDVTDAIARMGDFGPAEWACDVVGLPERGNLERGGEAARMLEAIALAEWWESLAADLDRLGASLLKEPTVDA